MIVRPARPVDAVPIGRVHVAAWRSAYAGILPDASLRRLSVPRQAAQYGAAIRGRRGVFVAEAEGQVVGFCTVGRARARWADGEVETLYVLDDWRDCGFGRALLQMGADRLRTDGARSLMLWVLRENPGRWFYQRMGGRAAAQGTTEVGGVAVPQIAYVWDRIETLGAAPAP